MKHLLIILFLSLPGKVNAQEILPGLKSLLIAQNSKHLRKYRNGLTLKIWHYQSGELIKSKGRLIVSEDNEIQLAGFGKRDTVSIETDSIYSVGRWHRSSKIAMGVLAGTGVIAGVIVLEQAPAGFNDAGFFLLLYALLSMYYVGAAIPSILLSELIGRRSVTKGYRFYTK